MKMSKTELKRCPFCDGVAITVDHKTRLGNVWYFVMCIECGNRTATFKSKKTAEKRWNRRNDEEIIIISRAEIDALNEYEEMIKKAKVIMPDVAEGKWIPVEERLPEPEVEVLILASRIRAGVKYPVITTAMYEDGTITTDESDWFWRDLGFVYDEEKDCCYIPEGWWEYKQYNPEDDGNHAVDDKVTHWMPLPEPPKGVLG